MRFTCTCSRSIALPSARFRRNDSTIVDLSRTRFKAYTVVEDEAWILFRVVLVGDVCFSNVTMSDINGGLQTFQQWIKCFWELYSTHPIQVDIEDRVDQRRFSNAALRLERSEPIVESINGI